MREAHGGKRGGGEPVVIRSRIRRCGTGWCQDVHSGASRGEIGSVTRVDDRGEGRAEGRVDFRLISISAEPECEACGRGSGQSTRKKGRGSARACDRGTSAGNKFEVR